MADGSHEALIVIFRTRFAHARIALAVDRSYRQTGGRSGLFVTRLRVQVTAGWVKFGMWSVVSPVVRLTSVAPGGNRRKRSVSNHGMVEKTPVKQYNRTHVSKRNCWEQWLA